MLKFKLLSPHATLPTRGTPGAAGLDLYASEPDVICGGGGRTLIKTDVAVQLPQGSVGLVWPRSGWAVKHGIDTLAGVIDADYTGEIGVVLINHGPNAVTIDRGDRVAQLVVQRYEHLTPEAVYDIPTTQRGTGGFGSTGK